MLNKKTISNITKKSTKKKTSKSALKSNKGKVAKKIASKTKTVNKKTSKSASKKASKKVVKKVAVKKKAIKKVVEKTSKRIKKSVSKKVKKTAIKNSIETKSLNAFSLKNKYDKPIWTLDIPYEWRMAVSSMGVRWDRQLKTSIFVGECLPPHLKMFKSKPFSLSWNKQFEINGRYLEDLHLLEPKFIPQEHQDKAIDLTNKAYLANLPGFVLADEVGVGKTMSAWGFALSQPSLKKILIITTASAQAHWRNTILHAGWLESHNITIINYDSLGKLFIEPKEGLTSNRRKGKRKRIAKQSYAPEFDLVIFDESHKGKNISSARGLMMRKIEENSKFCIWASATIGQNPIELIYLSNLLSFVSGMKVPNKTLEDFVTWCNEQGLSISRGAYGKFIWDFNSSDIDKIKNWIFNSKPPVGIRRLPEDIKNWPAMQRQIFISSLSFEKRQAYAKMWELFVEQEMMLAKSKITKSEISIKRENNKQRLRQQSSWLRIDSTVDEIIELLDKNKKVAVSVAFRDTLDKMVETLENKGVNVCFIHGSLSPDEKERQRLLFQKGNANVCVFTVEEAISLHQGELKKEDKARVLIIHDIRWSAIQMAQIEGRCHRDGKLAPVLWMVAEDTVDIPIAQVIIDKIKGMKSMHGDKLSDVENIEKVIQDFINRAV